MSVKSPPFAASSPDNHAAEALTGVIVAIDTREEIRLRPTLRSNVRTTAETASSYLVQ